MATLCSLPDAVWASILSYLTPSDMRSLLLLNSSLKEIVQPYIYHEFTLTEWASSGARLARAILDRTVSDSTVECIKKLRIEFTTLVEISEAVQLSLEIQPRMRGVVEIVVEAHHTEDALVVVGRLAQKYTNVTLFGVTARAATPWPVPVARQVLPLLTTLRIPRLFRHEVAFLTRIASLELDEVCEDGSMAILPIAVRPVETVPSSMSPVTSQYPESANEGSHALHSQGSGVIDRLAVPYSAYAAIGRPPCQQLELFLAPDNEDIVVDDPACVTLKLVTNRDLPQINPRLRTPTLRALILCNIAPLAIVRLVENNSLGNVEFISLAPVTIPALQALVSQQFLPALRLLLVIVTHSSFLSDSSYLQKREARKLVEWLQILATQYPVDVRDLSLLLRQDIYFSDGLWCLAAQTRYRRLLPLVAPPPLKT